MALVSTRPPSLLKVSLKLSVIKPLYAEWIVDLYKTFKDDNKWFRIYDLEDAKDMVEKVENPFKEV